MSKWLCAFAALVLCLSAGGSAWGQDQSSSRGNLSGVVYDPTKASVPGAEVTITGPIGTLTQTSNDQGAFLFSTLVPGIYSVRVQKPGFKIASINSAEVLIDKTTSIEIVLQTGEVTQIVEVNAATVTVDPTAASVNSDFSDSFYEKIPIGRSVSSCIVVLPAPVPRETQARNLRRVATFAD